MKSDSFPFHGTDLLAFPAFSFFFVTYSRRPVLVLLQCTVRTTGVWDGRNAPACVCIPLSLVKLGRVSVWWDLCDGLKEKEKKEKLGRRNAETVLSAVNWLSFQVSFCSPLFVRSGQWKRWFFVLKLFQCGIYSDLFHTILSLAQNSRKFAITWSKSIW